MEFYAAFADYRWLMDFTEELIRQAAISATGSAVLTYQERELDLSKPFDRLTICEAILKYAPGYPGAAGRCRLRARRTEEAGRRRRRPGAVARRPGALQLALFEETAEAKLWNPTYIIDYPVEVSPLARASDTREGITERFELFMTGREIANGFSELNDPRTRPSASVRRSRPRTPATRKPCTTTRTTSARWNTACPDRRLRHRHRPPGHAADRQPQHPRRDPVPAPAPRGLRPGAAPCSSRSWCCWRSPPDWST